MQRNGLVTLSSQEWEIVKIGSIYKSMQELNSKATEHNIVVLVEWAPQNNRLAPYIDNKPQICHELGVHSDYNLDMCFHAMARVCVCVCVCVWEGGGGGGSEYINQILGMLVYLHA